MNIVQAPRAWWAAYAYVPIRSQVSSDAPTMMSKIETKKIVRVSVQCLNSTATERAGLPVGPLKA